MIAILFCFIRAGKGMVANLLSIIGLTKPEQVSSGCIINHPEVFRYLFNKKRQPQNNFVPASFICCPAGVALWIQQSTIIDYY